METSQKMVPVAKVTARGAIAIVLFGPPGAGKGTQSRGLARRLAVPQISTGDMIRAEIRAGTELGQRVDAVLARGQLLDDETVTRMVEHRLAEADCRGGFLLDGFPRTAVQSQWIEEVSRRQGFSLLVIEIQVGYNELVRRVSGRRVCSSCGAIFHFHSHPPKIPDVCDFCQAPLVNRPDDCAEVLSERLRAYHRQTEPALEAFRREGRTIHAVDGAQPPEEVRDRILGILGYG